MARRPKSSSSLALRMRSMGSAYDMMSGSKRPVYSPAGNAWVPAADVADCEDHVVIRIEIPGIDPDDLMVLQEGRYLVIQGHRTRQTEPGEQCLHLMEIQYGVFERAFELPEYLDLDGITAQYEHGFLTVRLKKSKKPPTQPKVILIKVQESS